MNLKLIVAISDNHVIGVDNKIPWRQLSDLKYFSRMTVGNSVIMGRKTFQSIGKPLKNRQNIVMTCNPEFKHPDVTVVHGTDQLKEVIGDQEAFVIGGTEIYKLLIDECTELYITRIHCKVCYHPDVLVTKFVPDTSNFELIENYKCVADENNDYPYDFNVYRRKNI